MGGQQTSRARDLELVLRETGLGGQVHVGISHPVPPEGGRRKPLPYREDGGSALSELDALLGPAVRPARGQLIEVGGDASSGRTALAYRMAAGTTQRGELVAWIDLPNALDPSFLLHAGVDLDALLWVRPPGVQAAMRSAELLLKAGFATLVIDLSGIPRPALERLGAGVWTRLLRAVRQTRSHAILLGTERLAGSFATLALYTERRRSRFEYGLFEGLDIQASVVRDRSGPAGAQYAVPIAHRPAPS